MPPIRKGTLLLVVALVAVFTVVYVSNYVENDWLGYRWMRGETRFGFQLVSGAEKEITLVKDGAAAVVPIGTKLHLPEQDVQIISYSSSGEFARYRILNTSK